MGLVQHFRKLLGGRPAVPEPVPLGTLDTAQLQRSLAAGRELQAIAAQLAAEGRSAVDVALNGNAFAPWQMYPWQGGILDQRGNSQYFFHAHADYTDEHGHFHTFYYHQRKLVHLVAIGVDARGRILSLYTFNRWAPGDHYVPAAQLCKLLPRFRIAGRHGLDERLHRWVTAALRLFQAEAEHLFAERDATFARYREAHGGASPFEDRSLEITSKVAVDVETRLARLEAELRRRDALDAVAEPAAGAAVAPAAADDPAAALGAELAGRPTAHLQRSLEAGRAAQGIAARLRGEGRSVVEAVMAGKPYAPWTMYPWDGGVHDKATRSQYFYHAHPGSPEHGHFHVFYHHRNQLAHLVAIAMDNRGEPVSLFTVNRWVTDDFYLPADKLQAYVPQFRIAADVFDTDVHAFVRAMLLAFQAEIGALLHERDAAFAAYRAAHDGRSPFEDRELEVTSAAPIDLDAHVARLAAELERRGAG